jgi:glyoxylase-like metal-dependent hydrolase (beta-lactamase superfamily II)
MVIVRLAWVALAPILTACATAAGASPSSAPAQEAPSGVSFEALAPGVWLHLSTLEIEPWGEVPSYGLVVVRDEGALLVDTAWTDAQTEVILRFAEETLGRPITAGVFTHAHQDKMGGVAALRARGVETYAAADSNALAAERGLVAAEHALSFGPDGVSRELAPAIVFDPGAGHTEDNIVVALPQSNVLFGGCLIRPAGAIDLGNTADADVGHWAEAVEAVAARFPDLGIVVPSHGRPAGRELLSLTTRLAHEQGARPVESL